MLKSLTIPLGDREYLELCDILKVTQLCESGGAAKHIIAEGVVTVDGVVETRKRCKIRLGQVIQYKDSTVKVV